MGKDLESASLSCAGKDGPAGALQEGPCECVMQDSKSSQVNLVASSSAGAAAAAALKKRTYTFVFFHMTQVLLGIFLLLTSIVLLYTRFVRFYLFASDGHIKAAVIWGAVSFFVTMVTIVPQVAFLVKYRMRPTWWMLVDLGLAGVDIVAGIAIMAYMLITSDKSQGAAETIRLLRDVWGSVLGVVALTCAVRMYVRQTIYADVAHARWHELHVGNTEPRVSSFLITYRACKVLLREAPLEQAGYLLCAFVAAAQGPIVSMVVSAAISTAPAQLQLAPVIGSLCGAILGGQLATAFMSILTARSFAVGCEALQRRLALKAVYGTDPNTGLLTSTFSQGLAKVQQLVLVLQKQPFEIVSGFLPEILMQANSQVASIMINAKTEQQEAKQ